MKIHRIYGLVLRHWYNFIHSYDRLSDAFYWPTVDLLLWGLTSAYFQKFAPNGGNFVLIIMSGILFWIVTWRGQYEVSLNILTELWDRNLMNIFITPLKFSELIVSLITLGIIKTIMSLSFAAAVAFLLYKVNIFFYGFYLLPFLALLLMSGWWIGFLIAGIILRYGTKIQTLAWTVTWAAAPFSAIYFPVDILPQWAQTVARLMPTSYVFEGAREIISSGLLDVNKLYISFALNLLYLTLSILFFRTCFKKALNRGLQSVN